MAYTTAEAEAGIETVISRVRRKKQRVALMRKGKPIAAVVPVEDLAYLEALEAEEDAEDIRACKAALKSNRKALIPWEDVKKELGYD